jgi:uncharacterized lipoprotein YbaY
MRRTVLGVTLLVLCAIAPALAGGSSRLAVLPGKITIDGGGTPPPGSLLRVTLHDLTPGISRDAMVANASFAADVKPPLKFELKYDEAAVEPSRLYGVAAVVTDSRGTPLWETRVPIRVLTMGNQKKVELVVRPVDKPKGPPPDPNAFTLDCGSAAFPVERNDHEARIKLSTGTLVLPRVETSFGKKYSDGASTLTIAGQAAYFQHLQNAYRDCKVKSGN